MSTAQFLKIFMQHTKQIVAELRTANYKQHTSSRAGGGVMELPFVGSNERGNQRFLAGFESNKPRRGNALQRVF